MQKIAVVTDSNSGIRPEEAKKLGIGLIPMPIYLNDRLYFENLTLHHPEFYEKLRADADVRTSQPFPADLTELWGQLLEKADAVVYIPMSSSLSGSCGVAKALAAEEFPGRVFVADNRRISVSQRQSVLEALALAEQGMDAAAIVQKLEAESLNAGIYIAVSTMKYLKKGGRITPAAATIAAALNLKPVLQIQGDKLDAYKKVRGMEAACTAMLDALHTELEGCFAGQKVRLYAAYTGDAGAAEPWLQRVREAFPGQDIECYPLPLSVSCHLGEGALGVSVVKCI